MNFIEDDVHAQKETTNPTWDYIENCLKKIDPNDRAYFILADNKNSYVQCSGNSKKLCIEFREVADNSFKHYVIGEKENALNIIWAEIHSRVGPITIHLNEVLDITQAITIFNSFYLGGLIPETYNKRNVTKQFL